MNAKKKPVNGLLIVAIMAAAVWYGSYVQKNPFMGKQFETFVHMGQSLNDVESLETSTTGKFGYIKPQVVDGFSEEPIEGATVVIPETNTSYKTDEMGYTPDIRIEIVPDIRFKNINPKTWGEATLIAYKEGYIEYVLLNINIWESQNRQGPKIRLFPKENQQLDQPMSIVEGPNQLWINSLVEKYRP
ncbi:MAG: hypothetical protein ACOX1R_03555 [Caldicoprobacterales bacterium]|nr:carboxypeptidase-like regulatory domain-containing protein [Clostridiales bacterium]